MKHSLTIKYTSVGDTVQQMLDTVATTGQQAIEMDVPLAASATPIVNVCAFDPAKVKGMLLSSDVACTVEGKNSSAVTQGTVTLAAGVPFVFFSGTNPAVALTGSYAAAVATLTVVNTSSPLAAGTLKVRILTDPS